MGKKTSLKQENTTWCYLSLWVAERTLAKVHEYNFKDFQLLTTKEEDRNLMGPNFMEKQQNLDIFQNIFFTDQKCIVITL